MTRETWNWKTGRETVGREKNRWGGGNPGDTFFPTPFVYTQRYSRFLIVRQWCPLIYVNIDPEKETFLQDLQSHRFFSLFAVTLPVPRFFLADTVINLANWNTASTRKRGTGALPQPAKNFFMPGENVELQNYRSVDSKVREKNRTWRHSWFFFLLVRIHTLSSYDLCWNYKKQDYNNFFIVKKNLTSACVDVTTQNERTRVV